MQDLKRASHMPTGNGILPTGQPLDVQTEVLHERLVATKDLSEKSKVCLSQWSCNAGDRARANCGGYEGPLVVSILSDTCVLQHGQSCYLGPDSSKNP